MTGWHNPMPLTPTADYRMNLTNKMTSRIVNYGAAGAAALGMWMAGPAVALEKEMSLVTKQPLGGLAVAGRLVHRPPRGVHARAEL